MRYTLMLLLCLFLLSGCNRATVVSAATSPLPTPYLTLQATAPPILFPSPTPVYTRSLLPTLTPSPTSTPTPGPTPIPVEPFVYCTLQGDFYHCEDRLLQMRFAYPAFMGEIERTELRLGLQAGVLYEYSMGERGAGIGGRSSDFAEGRDGWFTDQLGFQGFSAEELCEPRARSGFCHVIDEHSVVWGIIPQARWFCGDPWYLINTPRMIVVVDLPTHPVINGFGFTSLLLPPGMDADWQVKPYADDFCSPENQAAYDDAMTMLYQSLQVGTANPAVQARYDAMMQLAESIEGPYVGAGEQREE